MEVALDTTTLKETVQGYAEGKRCIANSLPSDLLHEITIKIQTLPQQKIQSYFLLGVLETLAAHRFDVVHIEFDHDRASHAEELLAALVHLKTHSNIDSWRVYETHGVKVTYERK